MLCSGAELARARSAQLRLQRGIWTSTNFGDLRRALAGELNDKNESQETISTHGCDKLTLPLAVFAASERLVLLGVDDQELRDYGMLLFHAGLYGRSFEYLNAYSTSLVSDFFMFYGLNALESIGPYLEFWTLNGQ